MCDCGTQLVMGRQRQRGIPKCIASLTVEETKKAVMKAVTAKMLVSLIGVALAAPFFVVALIVGARAVSLSHGASDDLLMVALAFGGAAASIVNGMGRRNEKSVAHGSNSACEGCAETRVARASMIHLGN